MKLFQVKKDTLVTVVINKSDTEFILRQHICKQDNFFEIEEMVIDVITPHSYTNSREARDSGAFVAAIAMGCPVFGFRRGNMVLVVPAKLVEVL